jgi:parallel beta-helix repeat protein
MSGYHHVTLRGDGAATISQAEAHTGGIKLCQGTSDALIENVSFTGPHTSPQEGTGKGPGIWIGDRDGDRGTTKSDITVRNCTLFGFHWAGIVVYGAQSGGSTARCERIRILDNSISGCQNGIFVYKNNHGVTVSGNTISDVWYDGIVLDTLPETDPYPSLENSEVVIADNIIHRAGSYGQAIGILLKGLNKGVAVTGNTVVDTGSMQRLPGTNAYGIYLVADSQNEGGSAITITANTILGTRATGHAYGVYLGDVVGAVVADNVIGGGSGSGLFAVHTRDVAISGNIVTDQPFASLYVFESSGVAISGNAFTTHPEALAPCVVVVTGTPDAVSSNVTITDNVIHTNGGAAAIGFYLDFVNGCAVYGNSVAGLSSDEYLKTGNAANVVPPTMTDANAVIP